MLSAAPAGAHAAEDLRLSSAAEDIDMREPIALPPRLVALLRADLTRMLGETAERVAILALYHQDRELDGRLNEELWELDAARKIMRKLRFAHRDPRAAIGLTLDDHPVLVARLLEKRLEKEKQRAEDIAAQGMVPDMEIANAIDQFLRHLSDQVTGSARVRREEARLERHPLTRPRPSRLLVGRRETSCS